MGGWATLSGIDGGGSGGSAQPFTKILSWRRLCDLTRCEQSRRVYSAARRSAQVEYWVCTVGSYRRQEGGVSRHKPRLVQASTA
jgi:hypothetical protein